MKELVQFPWKDDFVCQDTTFEMPAGFLFVTGSKLPVQSYYNY
jgi:hypothetical protein